MQKPDPYGKIAKDAQVEYVKFTFREQGVAPVYIIFEDKTECKEFIDKVNLCIESIWPQNAKQFASKQDTPPKAVSNQLRLRNRRYSYLESDKTLFIHKLSTKMRQHHTGFDVSQHVIKSAENKTNVEWIRTMWVRGEEKPCYPRIRFKVIVFKN